MAPASALRAARCSACSQPALRLLFGNAAETRFAVATARGRRFAPATAAATFATFRPSPRLLSDPAIEERIVEQRKGDQNSASSSSSSSSSSPSSESNASDDDVPWYLQVEAPRHPTLVQEAAPLPEIPEGAPKLMEPLLQFVSDELGMDDLELLDLRQLDPPPALGPDLLMLFGTARSERHLHVSADRLVRWLRGRGVSAQADGLLGRNELKIRLRRIARKAKLLGNAGVARGADDGISTGWICVNLGAVEGSHQEMEIVDEEGRPTGFGVPHTGSTVVVQLLTESRRKELDLETLWKDMLRRSLKRRGLLPPEEASQAAGSSPATSQKQPDPSGRRFFSTSTRRLSVVASSGTSLADIVLGGHGGSDAIAQATHVLRHDAESKVHLLGQLRNYLKSLPEEEVDLVLARGQGMERSAFLRLFDRAVENLPPVQAWEHRLWLWTTGRSRDLPGYDVDVAKGWLREIQLSGGILTRETCLYLIRAVFAVPATSDAAVRDQSAVAMEIIDTMFARGQKVLDHDVIVTVIESLVRNPSPAPEAGRILAQFEDLLSQADLPCPSDDLLIRLLHAYAERGNWERFWDVWRIPPRHCQGRSWRLYAHVYHIFAKDGHRMRCIDALRRCYYEMAREQPPVIVDQSIRRGLRECIRIADPGAEEIARAIASHPTRSKIGRNREFVNMLLESETV